jgi:hypothetical protein
MGIRYQHEINNINKELLIFKDIIKENKLCVAQE